MNTLALTTATRSALANPAPASTGAATAPRLSVWDERARKMGFPPSTR